MRVIKDGRSENRPKQIHCRKCKSVLEVEPKDIARKSYDQRDGNAYIFRCAVCTTEIWIDMHVTGWQGI